MARSVVTSSIALCVASAAEYSESEAVKNLYLSVSAYCGAPKFNQTYLSDWDCGPSCSGAGSVTDITNFEDSSKGVFGFAGHSSGHCILVFRGTSSGDGWKTDLKATLTDFNHPDCAGCKVETGFFGGYQAVRTSILEALSRYSCQDVSITGHSLGAALATIAAYDLSPNYTIKEVYNYGSPRVGNPTFAKAYDAKGITTFRVTHHKDPIPHGPTLGMGFSHVSGEIFYSNTTEGGYKVCQGGEDKSCADQFGGSLLSDIGLALCCSSNHLEYMQNAVSVPTDGDSCSHVALATAVDHAYLTTAAYCEPQSLQNWDCGAPCDNVGGGVQQVQPLNVPFQTKFPGSSTKLVQGAVRGYVGHFGDRCILSLRDLFSFVEGLELMKAASDKDFVDLGGDCKDCQISKVIYDALTASKSTITAALEKIGCSKDAESSSHRRLIVLGHGVGSSLGAVLAYELKNGTGFYPDSFGIEAGFQFGAPRTGNQAFVNAFRYKLGHDIFRVTHHRDPFLSYPDHQHGFVHMDQELFFDGDASWDPINGLSYLRCALDGEDPQCAQRHRGQPGSLTDHTEYLQPLVKVDMSESACKPSMVWA